MTRDEIKLVVFIIAALLIGAIVQRVRKHSPVPPPVSVATPTPHGWAKPPYVLKESKTRSASPASDER